MCFLQHTEPDVRDKGLFEFVKLHEILMDDTDVVRSAALNSDVSLSISAEKRLTYAFSLHDSPFLYLVSLQGDIPEKISKSLWFDEMKCRYEVRKHFLFHIRRIIEMGVTPLILIS